MLFGMQSRRSASRGSLLSARLGRVVAAIAVTTLALTSSAQAWWNDEWSMRKQITIDTSSTGANITDPVGTTPLLVRLHIGNFRFASAKPDGSDLRFIAGDDKTPLKHHVEKYDSLLGEALLWVSVPNVQPGAKLNFWLYYGNQKIGSANDPKGTYDADTLLVYHFTERGLPAVDSSAWTNNAQSTGQPADGSLIGTGVRLDGKTPVTIPASPSLVVAENSAWTWSAWVKLAALQRSAAIYSRRDGGNAMVIGLDDGSPFIEITNNGTVQRTSGGAPVAPGGWHHVAVVATPGLITLYLDGNAYATLNASLPALNSIALLGGDTAVSPPAASVAPPPPPAAPAANPGDAAAPPPAEVAAPGADPSAGAPATPPGEAPAPPVAAPAPPAVAALTGFTGDLDELVIGKTARPAGFIKLQATSQGLDSSKLVVFSVDEETAGWFSGYFGVLLKAVTLDGWVVIAILLTMALASWVVIFEKHSYLKRQKKGNDLFLPAFVQLQDDLTVLANDEDGDADAAARGKGVDKFKAMLRHSALRRIYLIGADEIRRRFPGDARGGSHILTAEQIAAIRSRLDAGLVRELQALNRLMVLLTISISGGPFLGLLGTVMGVMITFAVIAMSGDVNINAIAPGIAGALMATVAGLAVAIPALFAYNWLTLRIKDLASDMQVFVDEFTTKMAEIYSARRPDPILHQMAAE
jgi:biopolymer transport protein ExbB